MSESKAVAPVVSLTNNKLTTTSINVAEVFGKRHDHVIRDIEQLKANCPESFHAPNFGETFQDVPGPNGATRKSPMYLLTRDGLTLLVMGYTGKEAMKFKLAYIEAFNRMEAQLAMAARARTITSPKPSPDPEFLREMREWQAWLLAAMETRRKFDSILEKAWSEAHAEQRNIYLTELKRIEARDAAKYGQEILITHEGDLLERFLADICETQERARTAFALVYESFARWWTGDAGKSGERPPSRRWLSDNLRKRGYALERRGGRIHVYGLDVKYRPE